MKSLLMSRLIKKKKIKYFLVIEQCLEIVKGINALNDFLVNYVSFTGLFD